MSKYVNCLGFVSAMFLYVSCTDFLEPRQYIIICDITSLGISRQLPKKPTLVAEHVSSMLLKSIKVQFYVLPVTPDSR